MITFINNNFSRKRKLFIMKVSDQNLGVKGLAIFGLTSITTTVVVGGAGLFSVGVGTTATALWLVCKVAEPLIKTFRNAGGVAENVNQTTKMGPQIMQGLSKWDLAIKTSGVAFVSLSIGGLSFLIQTSTCNADPKSIECLVSSIATTVTVVTGSCTGVTATGIGLKQLIT